MKAYLFASQINDKVSAVTIDSAGANLPPAYGPWQPLNKCRPIVITYNADFIGQIIQQHGFYLLIPDKLEDSY